MHNFYLFWTQDLLLGWTVYSFHWSNRIFNVNVTAISLVGIGNKLPARLPHSPPPLPPPHPHLVLGEGSMTGRRHLSTDLIFNNNNTFTWKLCCNCWILFLLLLLNIPAEQKVYFLPLTLMSFKLDKWSKFFILNFSKKILTPWFKKNWCQC